MRIEDLIKIENYEQILKEKRVMVKHDGPYTMLKYGKKADFADEITRQCRGIVFRDGNIVCKPFDKFFNVQETLSADIDWSTAMVTEKIDGSLCCLWFDEEWHFSTSGTISADDAKTGTGKTFGEIIRMADNYKDIPFDKLDKTKTYMFEIVSPFNMIVIAYPYPHLYHIATRDRSGQYHEDDIGIEKPKKYPLGTLHECIEAAEKMNAADIVDQEGFVVHDKDWNMVKIKSPAYVLSHHERTEIFSKYEIIEAILSGEYRQMMKDHPEIREHILEQKMYLDMIEFRMEKVARMARQLYLELDGDRRATAEQMKKIADPVIGIDTGFWALDNDGCVIDYIKHIFQSRGKRLIQMIEKMRIKYESM